MNPKEFIDETIKGLNDENYAMLRDDLVGEYISFSYIDSKDVPFEQFAEKLCDYFEKVEIKTDKDIDGIISNYMSQWKDLVSPLIQKEMSAEGEDQKPVLTRARKYYDRAMEIRDSKDRTIEVLIDYSRVMMCLYTAIIKNKFKKVSDFDFSISCLDREKIIDSMKNSVEYETTMVLWKNKKSKFNLKKPYGLDKSVFLMTEIMFYCIKNGR